MKTSNENSRAVIALTPTEEQLILQGFERYVAEILSTKAPDQTEEKWLQDAQKEKTVILVSS